MTPEEKHALGYKAGQLYLEVIFLLIKLQTHAVSQKIQSLLDEISTFSPTCDEANSAICLFGGKGVTEERLLEYSAAVDLADSFFKNFKIEDYIE